MVESPLTAADRCSDTQDLAVPGTPYSSRARSVARVETAISIRRGLPMYLGLTSKPLPSLPPIRYWSRSEEHTSKLQSPCNLVCRLLLEKKKKKHTLTRT